MQRKGSSKVMWLICICSLLVTGCFDSRDVLYISYAKGIAVDYQDGKYKVYVQFLDFNSVAKQETGATKEVPVWTMTGTGETVQVAMNQLYKASQMPIEWSFLSVIVFSERLLAHGVDDVIEGIVRARDIRYTAWVYGATPDLLSILTRQSIFHMSPLATPLHSPTSIYEKDSLIKPMRLVDFLATYSEPSTTVLLPSLTVNGQKMQVNTKKRSVLQVNGIFAIYRKKLGDSFRMDDLHGIPWLSEAKEITLLLQKREQPQAVMLLENPKSRITFRNVNGRIAFSIKIEVTGVLLESDTPLTNEQWYKFTVAEVKKQIRHTFQVSKKKRVDLLQLEERVYRKDFKEWKKHTNVLRDATLENIDVKLVIVSYGKYRTL